MWSNDDILANVIPALKQSLANGAENKMHSGPDDPGLTDWNLNYFIDQVLDFNLGGLFI